MTLPAISVTGLGKMYHLAHQGKRTNTFREAITSTVLAPFRRLRQLRGTDSMMEEFWALKDVSFDIQPGEVVGIIGRNGAGKSTLLKILSRIVEPTTGEIRLRGRVASLLEVGTGFHPELTGRENIYLNGSILGMKRREIDRKFDEIVDFAEVGKFLDTPVKRYSSGMYVRLAFAVAAHLDPEILIVDEVLAVGDAEFQKKCLGKIKEVSTGTGRTVLFVSHNMAAVQSLCSRGLVLSHGGLAYANDASNAVLYYMDAGLSAKSSIPRTDGSLLVLHEAKLAGDRQTQIRTLEAAVLTLKLRPKAPLRSFGFHIFIESVEGIPIGDIDSYPSYHVGSLEHTMDYEITIKLSAVPLRPGEYRLRLVLRDDHDYRGMEINSPLRFEIYESEDPQKNCRYGSRFGVLAMQYRVCVNPS